MTGDSGPTGDALVVIEGRTTEVGGMPIRRLLPRRPRRTVGAWCFLDHMGPIADPAPPMAVGPHPHIGLQTVTWLLEGAVRHTDSIGSDVSIVPGQLNLMSAGHGIAHAEAGTASAPVTHGVQLWIAQPEATRTSQPSFDHHAALPTAHVAGVIGTVLVGEFGGVRSPAKVATPIVGVDLAGPGRATLDLDPAFEYVIAPLSGTVTIADSAIALGSLADLGRGRRSVQIGLGDASRALLLGGEPFDEPILMWWNFVARSREEIEEAWRAWSERAPRFGVVNSTLERIETPPPLWTAR